MKAIRLLLVDDEAQVRRGLRMLLGGEPDLQVVGEAGDGGSALELAASLAPDVVLMDLNMPGMNGLQAAAAARRAGLACRVVVLSLDDDADTRRRAEAAGAAAFVGKQEQPDRLLNAIRLVAGLQDTAPGQTGQGEDRC